MTHLLFTVKEVTSKWEGYSLYGIDITDDRQGVEFFNEYKIARDTLDYTTKMGRNYVQDKKEYEENIFNNIMAMKVMRNTPRPTEHIVDKISKIIPDRRSSAKMDKLVNQAHILTYIADGPWRTKKLMEGDQIRLFWFGISQDLPLIWFVVSQNKTYMRLHAWARSLLAEYLYPLAREGFPEAPRRAGVFVLSWLLNNFKVRKLYGHFLKDSISVFKLMDTDAMGYLSKDQQDNEEAMGEPEVIEITKTMWFAHLDEKKTGVDIDELRIPMLVESKCVLCGARNPGFYTREYGKNIRFCGAKECGFQ